MFDVSLSELMVVAVVAVLVLGPKELPNVVRGIVKLARGTRKLAFEARQAFESLAEVSGVKEELDAINKEVRMIRGDDGNWYESYRVPDDKP